MNIKKRGKVFQQHWLVKFIRYSDSDICCLLLSLNRRVSDAGLVQKPGQHGVSHPKRDAKAAEVPGLPKIRVSRLSSFFALVLLRGGEEFVVLVRDQSITQYS